MLYGRIVAFQLITVAPFINPQSNISINGPWPSQMLVSPEDTNFMEPNRHLYMFLMPSDFDQRQI